VVTANTRIRREIKPQEGFQTAFLSSVADIAIGGGSAGGGKSFVLLLEALYDIDKAEFAAMMFRRTSPMIKMSGGLWSKSVKIFTNINGANPVRSELTWTFKSGAVIAMRPIEHEDDVEDYQGAEFDYIAFDELTHFERSQFVYMISRNRGVSGAKRRIRATCNPDPDSWVASFIEWWIDQETGYPIKERCGKLRYMISQGDNIVWGNSKQEVINAVGDDFWLNKQDIHLGLTKKEDYVKSVTFIPGSIYENKELLANDPGYMGNLAAQSMEDQARLLEGNWKIRSDGRSLFEEHALTDLFSNFVPDEDFKCITCDAARFGKDLMVIKSWKGWRVVRTTIAKKSDEALTVRLIEDERKAWGIQKSNVVVDQDGVGGGVVTLGGYRGFRGNAAALPGKNAPKDEKTGKIVAENYKNLKTQCFYRMADRVNAGSVQVVYTSESVCVVEEFEKKDGTPKKNWGLTIMIEGKTYYLPDLLKKQLRVIKKAKEDTDLKKQINGKDEQKAALGGMSPDLADCLSMREFFELKHTESNLKKFAGLLR
jgi:hypothetical protein